VDRAEKLNLIAKHKPLAWFGEGGVIQKAIEPMLRRRMRERKMFCRLEWLPSGRQADAGAVVSGNGGERAGAFRAGRRPGEFLSFPAGKHDDEVDTASLIGRAIDQAHPAVLPIKAEADEPARPVGPPEATAATIGKPYEGGLIGRRNHLP
jgi:hypothetical protein